MKTFVHYLVETFTFDEEALGHLTHTKDLPHEEPTMAHHAPDLIREFHHLRQGKTSTVGASLKTDGGSSIIVGHDGKGGFVSDKHRAARGVVARTPDEVDQHFGKYKDHAESLKHVLSQAKTTVTKGHTVQGDLLFTPQTSEKTSNRKTTATPNRLSYKIKTEAPLGIAFHTEITNGVAHSISSNALQTNPNVFVPEHKYVADPSTYEKDDREGTERHLNAAEALLKGHSTHHLTSAQIPHLTKYFNGSTRTSQPPSVEGYKKHLKNEGDKRAEKLKTAVGQHKKQQEFKQHIDHVDKYQDDFQRTIDIRHHLGMATEHVLKGVQHPDMETFLDGKPAQGEGIVLQKKDKQGKMRPVTKLVPEKISNAILNNPRFAK